MGVTEVVRGVVVVRVTVIVVGGEKNNDRSNMS